MKRYKIDNITTDHLLDPFRGRSPMTDNLFRELGGTIEDDGELSPKEKFFSALNSYLSDLEAEVERLALDISIDEFKAAAGSMMSSELIAWAKSKGVPDEMIEIVRPKILTFTADASRIGLTWGDIFPKPSN